jgi:hypothetical protein
MRWEAKRVWRWTKALFCKVRTQFEAAGACQVGGERDWARRPHPPEPRPRRADQWEAGMLVGGRCGRVATARAGRWRRALPAESSRAWGCGAMEGLEGEEEKGCGPGGYHGSWTPILGGGDRGCEGRPGGGLSCGGPGGQEPGGSRAAPPPAVCGGAPSGATSSLLFSGPPDSRTSSGESRTLVRFSFPCKQNSPLNDHGLPSAAFVGCPPGESARLRPWPLSLGSRLPFLQHLAWKRCQRIS